MDSWAALREKVPNVAWVMVTRPSFFWYDTDLKKKKKIKNFQKKKKTFSKKI